MAAFNQVLIDTYTYLKQFGVLLGTKQSPTASYIVDTERQILNQYAYKATAVTTTTASAITAGDTTIDLVSATGFVIGDTIQTTDNSNGVIFYTITAILTNTITLDMPIDSDHAIGITITVVDTELNSTAGTLAVPIAYRITPPSNKKWFVREFIISLIHSTAGDDIAFGNLTALTNGVVVRIYKGENTTTSTFTNWKANKDIKLDVYNLQYSDKAGGGKFGTSADGKLKDRTGASAILDGSQGDYLEFLVQDDITALDSFQVKIQGYQEQL